MDSIDRAIILKLQNVTKNYGPISAVNDVSLDIMAGECLVLLGPSGCGKSTLLRLIAGLEKPDRGKIWVGGELASLAGKTVIPARKRQIAMVFQSYALWPHMSVFGNIAYPLKKKGYTRETIAIKVKRALEQVELSGFDRRKPSELSGGQQQRVGLARALVAEPRCILYDEPLSNLDANLRRTMLRLISQIHETTGIGAVYVTHDQSEARAVGDRVAVMKNGCLLQVGDMSALFRWPNSQEVATFLGIENILHGRVKRIVDNNLIEVAIEALGSIQMKLPKQVRTVTIGSDIDVAIRGKDLRVVKLPAEDSTVTEDIRGEITLIERDDIEQRLFIKVGDLELLSIRPLTEEYICRLEVGDCVKIDIFPECIIPLIQEEITPAEASEAERIAYI